MVNINDLNRFKKAKVEGKRKHYSAEFEIREIITDNGTLREVPLIVFKSRHGKYMAQYYQLNAVRVNNFPELASKFSEYFASKYDGSLESADPEVKEILISYGFYTKNIAVSKTRDFILALLYDFDEAIKVKVIKYLEANNAFVFHGKKDGSEETDKLKDKLAVFEAKLAESEARAAKNDALIKELLQAKAVNTKVNKVASSVKVV